MREILVEYHQEPEGCWADSPDVEGFVVAGDTLEEVRELVRDGLAFYLDSSEDDLDIRECLDASAPLVITHMTTGLQVDVTSSVPFFAHVNHVSAPVAVLPNQNMTGERAIA